MCTVTYIPQDRGFILSSNRDEAPHRATTPIHKEVIKGRQILYPRDVKGGSWIIAAENKVLVCVLNGALIKHRHNPPYKTSRGLVAKDMYRYKTPFDFIEKYDFIGIEPFTFVIASEMDVIDFRWDGKQKHISHKDPGIGHIWSSSTLYDRPIQQKREALFLQFLKEHNHKPDINSISLLHRNGNIGDETQNFVMNRDNRVMTVSITQVIVEENHITMNYESLLEEKDHFTDVIPAVSEK